MEKFTAHSRATLIIYRLIGRWDLGTQGANSNHKQIEKNRKLEVMFLSILFKEKQNKKLRPRV